MVIQSSDITSKVLQVLIRKINKLWSYRKLFIQVGNCPEQVGETVMLQQAGILEQRQQKLPLLLQEGFEPAKVYISAVNLNFEVMRKVASFLEIFLCPVLSNVQVTGNLQAVIEMFEEVSKEEVAQFAEKSSHHHIEFLQFSLPLSAGQEALDDDHH